MPIRVLCLAGATGTGKTDAALFLAEMLKSFTPKGGAIINADSRQVYRDFPLITAQPTPQEQTQCPHRLYGQLESTEKMNAGLWTTRATAALAEFSAQGYIPILVGGTGLYMRALFDGMVEIPPVPPAISAYWKARHDTEGSPALHAELAQNDPDYAARIHPNDKQRVIRALEVLSATQKTFSWWHSQTPQAAIYSVLRLGLDLPLNALTERLALRIEAMLQAGAEAEARAAYARCANAAAPAWSGIGCAEMYQYIRGTLTVQELQTLWLKNTRAYAKRQRTWFHADKRIHWFEPRAYEKMGNCVREFLQSKENECCDIVKDREKERV